MRKDILDACVDGLARDVKANHSPLPWAVAFNHRGHGHGDYGVIETDRNTLIAKVETAPCVDAHANAAHIVLCVNSHADLLAACKRMRKWQVEPWGTDDSAANESVIDDMDAAIAKAQP